MLKWERMRFKPFRRLFAGLLGCLCFCQCSLSLENPEDDARKKLAKPIPTTLSALEGRWVADSTYTVDDIRAHRFQADDLLLEIFADTTLSARDTTRIVFPPGTVGHYSLSGDSLFHRPVRGGPGDTLIVKIRFLGNWLELFRPAEQRYAFFHKLKGPDSSSQDTLLEGAWWRLQGWQAGPDSFLAEPLRRDFSYLRFSGDTLVWDWRLNGIARSDRGILAKDGRIWNWEAGGGSREFLADIVSKDTLRLWPSRNERPDSGFRLFIRTLKPHPFDLDMGPWLGHMRTDSVLSGDRMSETHYGRFYDLEFGLDHAVRTITNRSDLPLLRAWTLDSGFLWVDAPDANRIRLQADTAGNVVRLRADSGKAFPRKTALFQTKVDPARYEANPLERFDRAGYAVLHIGGDTLRYFFNANYRKAAMDEFEIADLASGDTSWLIAKSDPEREVFQSGQSGFKFAFQGRIGSLGRFDCRSDTALEFALRLTDASDPEFARGLLQGACRILSADSAFTDSTLALEGSFRFRRKAAGGLASPWWTRP